MLEILRCPVCSAFLTQSKHLTCSSCGKTFPAFNDIPCLMPDPELWKAHWLFQLQSFESTSVVEEKICEDELQAPQLSKLTRDRLRTVKNAKAEQRAQARELLSPLLTGKSRQLSSVELHRIASAPQNQTLPYHALNILRDWGWGEAENAASLALARDALGSTYQATQTLVLGAGACRLTIDLHLALQCTRTFALDYNPLLLFAARRAMRAEPFSWTELPVPPISIDKAAVRTACARPSAWDPAALAGVQLLIGDALRAPFSPASFDCVVTPWFIDVVPVDIHSLLPVINRLLKPGGIWLHFGPLGWTGPSPSRRYTLAEMLEVAQKSGFAQGVPISRSLPYLRSPASPQGREELVHSIAFKKSEDAEPALAPEILPDWARDTSIAVPVLPEFASFSQSTQTALQILSLVDGRRSILAMADAIAASTQLDRDTVMGELREILLAMANRPRS